VKVLALLKDKSRPVHTIASNQSVEDAIRLMARGKASALLVTENDRPAGIFRERDVYHTYLQMTSTAFSEIALEDVMTRNLVVVNPQDTLSAVITRMIEANITHLSVVEEERIVGMLTLVDLMEYQIEALDKEIHQLNEYIADLHDAGQD
jgi:CBS domain-containing protein